MAGLNSLEFLKRMNWQRPTARSGIVMMKYGNGSSPRHKATMAGTVRQAARIISRMPSVLTAVLVQTAYLLLSRKDMCHRSGITFFPNRSLKSASRVRVVNTMS